MLRVPPRTETGAKFNPSPASWSLFGGLVRPNSRGQIRLTGPNPNDPIQIEANTLSHPDDLKAAVACVELCREIGNSAALRPLTKCEVMPGDYERLFGDSGKHRAVARQY